MGGCQPYMAICQPYVIYHMWSYVSHMWPGKPYSGHFSTINMAPVSINYQISCSC